MTRMIGRNVVGPVTMTTMTTIGRNVAGLATTMTKETIGFAAAGLAILEIAPARFLFGER